MKNILLIISLLILVSSCSMGNTDTKDTMKEDTQMEETNNKEVLDTQVDKEEKELKDIEDNKVVDDNTDLGGKVVTSTSSTSTGDATEEEIVKEFENELDDLFKSLEGYE